MGINRTYPTGDSSRKPGIALGIGLEVQYTIGALAVAIAIAILLTPTSDSSVILFSRGVVKGRSEDSVTGMDVVMDYKQRSASHNGGNQYEDA